MNDSNDFSAPDPVSGFPTNAQPDSSSESRQAVPPSEAEGSRPVAFCQTCGRSLTRETARPVGQAIFCEPCLEARLAGGPAQPPPPPGAYGQVPYAQAFDPAAPSLPNPGLATILGFIPGVGAMYNEQYAKGIVHLIVFVLLIIITGSYGIFGIFIAGWEFYMAIDANHTARARRDGLPVPNPFGLNDIGERLGFGKAWPTGSGGGSASNSGSAAQQAARGATAEASRAVRGRGRFRLADVWTQPAADSPALRSAARAALWPGSPATGRRGACLWAGPRSSLDHHLHRRRLSLSPAVPSALPRRGSGPCCPGRLFALPRGSRLADRPGLRLSARHNRTLRRVPHARGDRSGVYGAGRVALHEAHERIRAELAERRISHLPLSDLPGFAGFRLAGGHRGPGCCSTRSAGCTCTIPGRSS